LSVKSNLTYFLLLAMPSKISPNIWIVKGSAFNLTEIGFYSGILFKKATKLFFTIFYILTCAALFMSWLNLPFLILLLLKER
jgi:hypothetical protein